MDRSLEKKPWWAKRQAIGAGVLLVILAGVMVVAIGRGSASRLRVDSTRLTIAPVRQGEFRELYPFDGTVEPVTTVFLDVDEGGRVDEILIEGGRPVRKGDLILRFSNASLQRNSIDTETRLVENMNALRNTELSLAQNLLTLKDRLLDQDYRIADLQKTYERYQNLMAAESGTDGVLSREVFERTRDQLAYEKGKRLLLIERMAREDVLTKTQLQQAAQSISRLNESRDLLNRIMDSLEVRAPIDGFLSNISAEVGQNIGRGQRIGQVDVLDRYKLSLKIDQYYISRVQVGTAGSFELDGKRYSIAVSKVYPEVQNETFLVDASFSGEVPPTLRRGQRLTADLSFSKPSQALMVTRGGFQQHSGGRWVYLVSSDRRSARRASVKLGRQNPRSVEVLEGLRAGDWIVSSSYELFNDVDELIFEQPVRLSE